MRFLPLLLLACGPSPQVAVRYPAVAYGVAERTFAAGEWTVTLDEARIAFGPLYFCAARALCALAQTELLTVTVLDLLSPDAQPLGEVTGLTGDVRSAAFDYGITWLTTDSEPRPRTELLHSAVFVGSAVRGDERKDFRVELDILPLQAGVRAVTMTRVPTPEGELEVRFDPRLWWGAVDFTASDASIADLLVIQMSANAPPELR